MLLQIPVGTQIRNSVFFNTLGLIGQIAGMYNWKHGRKGSGIYWLQQARDEVRLNRIAQQLFECIGKPVSDDNFKVLTNCFLGKIFSSIVQQNECKPEAPILIMYGLLGQTKVLNNISSASVSSCSNGRV